MNRMYTLILMALALLGCADTKELFNTDDEGATAQQVRYIHDTTVTIKVDSIPYLDTVLERVYLRDTTVLTHVDTVYEEGDTTYLVRTMTDTVYKEGLPVVTIKHDTVRVTEVDTVYQKGETAYVETVRVEYLPSYDTLFTIVYDTLPVYSSDTIYIWDTTDVIASEPFTRKVSKGTTPIYMAYQTGLLRQGKDAGGQPIPVDLDLGVIKETTSWHFMLRSRQPLLGVKVTTDNSAFVVAPDTFPTFNLGAKDMRVVPLMKLTAVHGKGITGNLTDVPIIRDTNSSVSLYFSGKMIDTTARYYVRGFHAYYMNDEGFVVDTLVTDTIRLNVVSIDTVEFGPVEYVMSVQPRYLEWSWSQSSQEPQYSSNWIEDVTFYRGVINLSHAQGCKVRYGVKGLDPSLAEAVRPYIAGDTVRWDDGVESDCVRDPDMHTSQTKWKGSRKGLYDKDADVLVY